MFCSFRRDYLYNVTIRRCGLGQVYYLVTVGWAEMLGDYTVNLLQLI